MEPLPLPSHIHYETILQILERKTQRLADQDPLTRDQIQQLILTLRKAFSQQKQLERSYDQLRIPYEYHWSLTNQAPHPAPAPPYPPE
ncbi:hypothetical protein FLX56_05505 [Synechococcus moorigangaii CMS01]|nr:hypothetical protein [Synechococcus moorigangaii CMS01]